MRLRKWYKSLGGTLKNLIPGILSTQNSMMASIVRIGSVYGRCRLALVRSLHSSQFLRVVAKINEAMFVRILSSTAIREVVDFLYFRKLLLLLLNVPNRHLLESTHSQG